LSRLFYRRQRRLLSPSTKPWAATETTIPFTTTAACARARSAVVRPHGRACAASAQHRTKKATATRHWRPGRDRIRTSDWTTVPA